MEPRKSKCCVHFQSNKILPNQRKIFRLTNQIHVSAWGHLESLSGSMETEFDGEIAGDEIPGIFARDRVWPVKLHGDGSKRTRQEEFFFNFGMRRVLGTLLCPPVVDDLRSRNHCEITP